MHEMPDLPKIGRHTMNYANAKDILPVELFNGLQRCYSGLLWVSAPRANAARDAKIRELFAQGVGYGEIATLFGMSERRVREISKGIREELQGKASLAHEDAEFGGGFGLSSKSEGRDSSPRQTDVEPRLERVRCAPHVRITSRRKKRLDAKRVSLTVPPAAQALTSRREQSSY